MRRLIGKVLIGIGAAILIAAVFIEGIGLPFGVILAAVGGWLIWRPENTRSDDSVSKQLKYSRVVFGVLVPIVVLIAGMLVLANVDSSAGAAEFAALGVFFMLLIAIPITIVGNLLLLPSSGSALAHFSRGMVLPCVAFLCAIIYQTGLWDAIT